MAILHNWATGDDEVMEGRYPSSPNVEMKSCPKCGHKYFYEHVCTYADMYAADADAAIQRDLAQRKGQND